MSDLTVAVSSMVNKNSLAAMGSEQAGKGVYSGGIISSGSVLTPHMTSVDTQVTTSTTTSWSNTLYQTVNHSGLNTSSLFSGVPRVSSHVHTAGHNVGHFPAGSAAAAAVPGISGSADYSAGLPRPIWRTEVGDINIPGGIPPANTLSHPTPSKRFEPVQPDLPTWLQQSAALLGHPSGPGSSSSAAPVTVVVDAAGIKQATKKRKCVVFDLDPHLYFDNAKNANIEDIVSANMSLMESLMALGIPVSQYCKHIRFLSDKSRVYMSAALVKYDKAVREKAELLGPLRFAYGDMELVHAFLGVESVKPKPKSSLGVTHQGTGASAKKTNRYCWRFNGQKGCKKDDCTYKHECRTCGGPHSVTVCTEKR